MRVGVFDSGIGGLTVLRACVAVAPYAKYIYYGDNGNAPYGNRAAEEIAELTDRGVDTLLAAGAEIVVLACNTATAVCAERLRERLDVPVVGMEPAVKPAAARCRRVLLLSTARTAESGRLGALVARFPRCDFTVHAAEGLAGAIERHLTEGAELRLTEHLPKGEYDGVVLGCTHYVFYRERIAVYYGVPVFDGNRGTAQRVRALLGGSAGGAEWSKTTKTNKSLPSKWSESAEKGVIFLGEWAETNQKVYKQTFGRGNLSL